MSISRWTIFGALSLAVLGLGPVCSAPGEPGSDVLTIGAYSVVREALHEGIVPAFQEHWKRKTGRAVRFEESYNGSGAQSRAIAAGFDADVAVLSLEDDMVRLVQAGLVDPGWNKGPRAGVLTNSLVVIGRRDGNPKEIGDWNDLTRPGVGVLYPDPKTSGGAKWNINAIYGAGLFGGRKPGESSPDPQAARELLARVQANVVNMDGSGRQSLASFDRGIGDAVVTYENEILLQRKRGKPVPYVVPRSTLLIESPAALVESSIRRHGNREVAEAFLAYLLSDEGQRTLAEYGFRPLDPRLDSGKEPLPDGLFRVKDLGGWPKVQKEIYGKGGVWESIFTQRKMNKQNTNFRRP